MCLRPLCGSRPTHQPRTTTGGAGRSRLEPHLAGLCDMLDSGFLRRPCVACLVVSVVIAGGFTPGPIPNPEAKAPSADGTALARVWESRTPPSTHVNGEGRSTPTRTRFPGDREGVGAAFIVFSWLGRSVPGGRTTALRRGRGTSVCPPALIGRCAPSADRHDRRGSNLYERDPRR